MTTWLTRQEAVHRFSVYLQWVESLPRHSQFGDDSDNEDTSSPEHDHASPRYSIAKEPGLPNTTVLSLELNFGCSNFIPTLEDFLRTSSRNRTLPAAAEHLISRKPTQDTIRAIPSTPAQRLKKATPAHFDTVLVRQTPGDYECDSDNPLDDLCVARVRAIFQLPEAYGAQFKHPLAHV
ncbi:hypothetical protein A0H81_13049 [Grifola frondosa]|uniref:Uncharacterized protein n=1 Tax=Grifola frondosa TaxID=5627 RepID=A0A1C7LR29_GRIFR|nr:hypothetical protein A0H81_13049 [Grifola frondosa]